MKRILSVITIACASICCLAETGQVRYWFDYDFSTVSTVTCEGTSFSISVPSQSMAVGMHTVTIQYKQQDNLWSPPVSSLFIKRPEQVPVMLYSFGNDPDNVLPISSDGVIDTKRLPTGMHEIILTCTNSVLPPASAWFYKAPDCKDNLTLVTSDKTGSHIASTPLSLEMREISVDLNSFPKGMLPLNFRLTNGDDEPLLSSSSLVEVKPTGGDGIKNLLIYIENDSTQAIVNTYANAEKVLTVNTPLDISGFDYEPKDFQLTVENKVPYISPASNLHVRAFNGFGQRVDSIIPFIDTYRISRLESPVLSNNRQFDYGEKVPACSWVEFAGQNGDNVNIKARLGCNMVLYSPEGEPVRDFTLGNRKGMTDNKDLTIDDDGIHYVKVKDVAESSQTFSLKLRYLSGPSSETGEKPDVPGPQFDGTRIRWEHRDEWTKDSTGFSYDGKLLSLTTRQTASAVQTRFSNTDNCIIGEGTELGVSSEKIIEKILFVPTASDLSQCPHIVCSQGEIRRDNIPGVMTWVGHASDISFVIAGNVELSDTVCNQHRLTFREMYATFSNREKDDLTLLPDDTSVFDGSSYSHLYVWNDKGEHDTFRIAMIDQMYFDSNEFVISYDGKETHYPESSNPIITFESKSPGSIRDAENMETPDIIIKNGYIEIGNAPSRVMIADTKGMVVYDRNVAEPTAIPLSILEKGVYIVKSGTTTSKIIVR